MMSKVDMSEALKIRNNDIGALKSAGMKDIERKPPSGSKSHSCNTLIFEMHNKDTVNTLVLKIY